MFGYFQVLRPVLKFKTHIVMNTNEFHQEMEPAKKNSGVLPFFLIIGGFVVLLVLIKLFM
jgi:hypothetical protein